MSEFKFIQIDEEGYPLFNGLRLQDKSFAKTLLENLKVVDTRNIFLTTYEQDTYVVESFDLPLVAQHIHLFENKIYVQFPYELEESLDLKNITVDEWDRFHGKNENGIPFVFSKSAQSDFFNLVEEFNDDGFFWNKIFYPIHNIYKKAENTSESHFWNEKYLAAETGWDMNGPHPALESIVSQLRINKCRILNIGCGTGHDANFFASKGHLVTAVDFSAAAIKKAQSLYGHRENLKFVQANAFHLPDKFLNSFDLIFEHTCFCAIPPHQRNDLIRSWKNCLVPGGHLLGLFFTHNQQYHPPFGGTEWEYRQRFKKYFNFLYWTRLRANSPRSLGSELIIYAQKN